MRRQSVILAFALVAAALTVLFRAPDPGLGAVPAPTVPAPVPRPFVRDFADRPRADPLPRLPSPTAPLRMRANVDGCDHSYGARGQCVPWRFPRGVVNRCGWLRERGFLDAPLPARSPDRHRLDPDRNGLACDD